MYVFGTDKATDFKFGTQSEYVPCCIMTTNYSISGHGLSHVTHFVNFEF